MWEFSYETWSGVANLRYEGTLIEAPLNETEKVVSALKEILPTLDYEGDEFRAMVWFRKEDEQLIVEQINFTIFPHHSNCPSLSEALEGLVE